MDDQSRFNLQQRTEITLSTQQLDKITTELSSDDKKAHVFDALKQAAIADLEQKKQDRIQMATATGRLGRMVNTDDLDERIAQIKTVSNFDALTSSPENESVRQAMLESVSTTKNDGNAFYALALIPHMADAPEARKQLIENISKGLQGKHDSHDDPVVREFLALLGDDTLSEDLRKELGGCVKTGVYNPQVAQIAKQSPAQIADQLAAEIDASIEKSDPQKMMHLIRAANLQGEQAIADMLKMALIQTESGDVQALLYKLETLNDSTGLGMVQNILKTNKAIQSVRTGLTEGDSATKSAFIRDNSHLASLAGEVGQKALTDEADRIVENGLTAIGSQSSETQAEQISELTKDIRILALKGKSGISQRLKSRHYSTQPSIICPHYKAVTS